MTLGAIDARQVSRARRLAALNHALGDFFQMRVRGNHRNSFASGGERAVDAGVERSRERAVLFLRRSRVANRILVEKLHDFHLENP
jgi:hypothetical protein